MPNKIPKNSKQNMVAGAKKSAQIQKDRKEERKKVYNLSNKRCPRCNALIPYEKRKSKYCSHSCSAQVNNSGIQRNITTGEWKQKPCIQCGSSTTNKKFCSSKCWTRHKIEKVFESIRKGKYKICGGGNSVLKRFLVQERGSQCEECKRKEWSGKDIPLTIHHIDGDATNNLPSNLQLLCWNCHAITENFGNKNKSSTRGYRYRKYGSGVGSIPAGDLNGTSCEGYAVIIEA